ALGIGLAHAGHLAPDALELLEDRLDMSLVLREMTPAFLGRVIELLGAFGLDPGIAQLLEICQGRIDHAGARHVVAAGALLQGLDQLVAMARLLGEELEQQQLQPLGPELAAAPEIVIVEARTAPEAPVPEAASTAAAAMAAHPEITFDF